MNLSTTNHNRAPIRVDCVIGFWGSDSTKNHKDWATFALAKAIKNVSDEDASATEIRFEVYVDGIIGTRSHGIYAAKSIELKRVNTRTYAAKIYVSIDELELEMSEFVAKVVDKIDSIGQEWLRVSRKRKYLIPNDIFVDRMELIKLRYQELALAPPSESFLNSDFMRHRTLPYPG